ncbi:protein shisa-5-like [Brachionichthys hirsutus]|uniref:protein shisa-5-like n=1 Tax=Brachionichthys hirsutus TaxID=412623 RepID=UPI003604B06C
MVSNIFPILVCAACLIQLPAVWADYCYKYWHTDGYLFKTRLCDKYCCGTCNKKYCCDDKKRRISEEMQDECTGGPLHEKTSKFAVILGIVTGVVVPVLFCVCLIICCMAPCCLCYKMCRKRQNRAMTTTTTPVVNTPLQPLSPSGYQPSHPGYQPVPVHPVYWGPPNPTEPPPSYLEANSPIYPANPPNPGKPPEELHGFSQPPYNPSYGLNREV